EIAMVTVESESPMVSPARAQTGSQKPLTPTAAETPRVVQAVAGMTKRLPPRVRLRRRPSRSAAISRAATRLERPPPAARAGSAADVAGSCLDARASSLRPRWLAFTNAPSRFRSARSARRLSRPRGRLLLERAPSNEPRAPAHADPSA